MKTGRDERWMRRALRLARRGRGCTSPNPMVGAVLVRTGRELGRGWHRRAGEPHAEIEALRDAVRNGHEVRGATLYVTLEPCSTTGRTPPCTDALLRAGLRRVVVGAIDPNPAHRGWGLERLKEGGIDVAHGILQPECTRLNPSFNHWIVHRSPWITAKAAMTLDGKIADSRGRARWITGPVARLYTQSLRRTVDAILVGVRTILADDPRLTLRTPTQGKALRRIVLDPKAKTPLHARIVRDRFRPLTVIVASRAAPQARVRALRDLVTVWTAPIEPGGAINLRWVLKRLGREGVTSLLVEGGGETLASFLERGLVHEVALFYAPKILTGRDSKPAVGGGGTVGGKRGIRLEAVRWRRLGQDLLLRARVSGPRRAL